MMTMMMSADAFKQLRSMILLELCCPPLPVMATRQETEEPTVTNTHDMLSVFMITAFKRQNAEENNRRKAAQIEAQRAYQDGLERSAEVGFAQTYAHMAQFMTSYLATYFLEGSGLTSRDIRVLPPEYISPMLREEIDSFCRALKSMLLPRQREEGVTMTTVDMLPRQHCLPSSSSANEYCSAVDQGSSTTVNSLFMSCIRCASHKKQQGVVGMPVLVGVGEDVDKEGHNPQALEAGVEVL